MKNKFSPFRDYSAESALFVRRALVALSGVFLLSSVLILNLFHLQVTRFENYRTRSNENRIKVVPLAPSRGIIYDRNGLPLALNRTIYQLQLIPEKVADLGATLAALQPIVELTDKDIAHFQKERRQSRRRFMPIVLKSTLTESQAARFAVDHFNFPGVEIKRYQRRHYPYRSALTHVVGYVAKKDEKDAERLDKAGVLDNYSASYDIGKLGIERYYESVLHGKTGYEEVEVNNLGRVIGQLYEEPPQAGADVYLTLDAKLQLFIEQLLNDSRAAVIVADPRSGDILALVSTPSYDANLFVDGISIKNYQELLANPDRPLINRAIQGSYPPASTIKPYIAVSALSSGVINKNTTLFDPGWWQLPGTKEQFRDWKKWGHGKLDVIKAIEESADTFFYQIAYDMGIDRLSTGMKKFGYGQRTGIDLPDEATGILPTREWKQKNRKESWYQGDTIVVGIGQGFWTATPMQMTKSLMTFINEGHVKRPHLLLNTRINDVVTHYHQQKEQDINDVHPSYWEIAKDGMYGVAHRPNGTARKSFLGTPYKVGAKTGTAQVYAYKMYDIDKISKHLHDHKMMSAFAPYDRPEVAVTIILENGGADGVTVGSITRKIFDYILLNNVSS